MTRKWLAFSYLIRLPVLKVDATLKYFMLFFIINNNNWFIVGRRDGEQLEYGDLR